MTTVTESSETESCPARGLIKLLSGKWKPEIFQAASSGPVRFSTLLRQFAGSNKQTLSVALKELEDAGLLEKIIIRQKPLHIEYHLSSKGMLLLPVFKGLEGLV